jgi:hypothetical protein
MPLEAISSVSVGLSARQSFSLQPTLQRQVGTFWLLPDAPTLLFEDRSSCLGLHGSESESEDPNLKIRTSRSEPQDPNATLTYLPVSCLFRVYGLRTRPLKAPVASAASPEPAASKSCKPMQEGKDFLKSLRLYSVCGRSARRLNRFEG